MKILCLLLLLALPVFAQDRVIVQSLDADVDLSELGNDYDAQKGLPEKAETKKQIPSPKTLEKLFKKAELENEVKLMDQLDRDFLFRKAEAYSLSELSQNYPDIPKSKLKTLQALIKEIK